MNLSITLSALLALQTQGPPAPAPAPAAGEREWLDLDRVVMVVNEDTITRSGLLRDLRGYAATRPITTEAQAKSAENEILTRAVKDKLAAQGGQDMGFDPKVVDVNVDRRFEMLIERQNGVTGMAAYLASQGFKTADAREYLRTKLYTDLWHDSITGEGVGPGGRPDRDRYVRPGMLRFQYDALRQRPDGLAKFGGQPALVTLQSLLIDTSLVGTPDDARRLAEDVRRRILEGEDMGQLVETYSIAKKDKGLSEPVPERGLADVDMRLFRFVSGAKVGDVSSVETVESEGKTLLRIVKLVERTDPVVPPLSSYDVQKKLRDTAQKQLDEYRLNVAYNELLHASYVWPAEFGGR